MAEKNANIDLLFRNGLKDFEVLPPPGVWDGIYTAVKAKIRPYIVLRVAAAITVLLTVSFLTYRWNREISVGPSGSVIAINIPVSSPVISKPVYSPQYLPAKQNNTFKNSTAGSIETTTVELIIQKPETITSPEYIINFRESKSLSVTGIEKIRESILTSLNNSEINQVEIEYPELLYFPESSITKSSNRWSIAAMASPTYYSRFNSGSDELSKQLMASEQAQISYSGGVAFSYKISKRFSVQSGLYYASLGQKVDGINSFGGFKQYNNTKGDHYFEVLTTAGTIHSDNPDVFLNAEGTDRISTAFTNDFFDPDKASLPYLNSSLNQNFRYVELPVVLRYKVVDKMIGINLIGGLSYNLLVHNSVYTTIDGNRYFIGDTKGLNPLILSSSLGMGMEYNFSDKLSLNLEPTFRYYLSPFSVSTGSYIHPYSFGIFSGISYKF